MLKTVIVGRPGGLWRLHKRLFGKEFKGHLYIFSREKKYISWRQNFGRGVNAYVRKSIRLPVAEWSESENELVLKFRQEDLDAFEKEWETAWHSLEFDNTLATEAVKGFWKKLRLRIAVTVSLAVSSCQGKGQIGKTLRGYRVLDLWSNFELVAEAVKRSLGESKKVKEETRQWFDGEMLKLGLAREFK
jgi:hypothetical protein